MKRSYKTTLLGILSVAIAFLVAIPLGFRLRKQYAQMSDDVIAAIIVTTIAVISVGLMLVFLRVLNRPSALAAQMEIMPPGTGHDHTGYEMTLHDFRRLIGDPFTQPAVAALLRSWWGYQVSARGDRTTVRRADGSAISLDDLHAAIQGDASKQYATYQEAMNFWR